MSDIFLIIEMVMYLNVEENTLHLKLRQKTTVLLPRAFDETILSNFPSIVQLMHNKKHSGFAAKVLNVCSGDLIRIKYVQSLQISPCDS